MALFISEIFNWKHNNAKAGYVIESLCRNFLKLDENKRNFLFKLFIRKEFEKFWKL